MQQTELGNIQSGELRLNENIVQFRQFNNFVSEGPVKKKQLGHRACRYRGHCWFYTPSYSTSPMEETLVYSWF
ncbi:hypothetical protein ACOSQ3_015158 [Xanthoceras sorbifolium]